MITDKTTLYCICGLIKASESFAADRQSHLVFAEELKTNHIPETMNLIAEESFHAIMAERCAAHRFEDIINSIVSKYNQLGCTVSITNCVDCVDCRALIKSGL